MAVTATGYEANGVDLNTLFKERTSTAISNVNLVTNEGVHSSADLASLFEPRAGSTAIANVNIQSAGADLSSLFMDTGATPGATVTLPVNTTATAADLISLYVSRAGYVIEVDGDTATTVNNEADSEGARTDVGDWVSNKTGLTSSDYQFNITLSSGSTPSGSVVHSDAVTWADISGELYWYQTLSGVGAITSELVLQIREKAYTSNLDSVTITLITENGGN